MQITPLEVPAVLLLVPEKFCDERGLFTEAYNKRALSALGVDLDFVQDNHSVSMRPGTIRGLHFQAPPFAQDKLVRVARGRIIDVAVDIRPGSSTFGQFVSIEIGPDDWAQILIPKGFAHGYCTLEPNTEVVYKTSNYYEPSYERGVLWNDPDLAIEWPVRAGEAVLSNRDRRLPCLKDLPDFFT